MRPPGNTDPTWWGRAITMPRHGDAGAASALLPAGKPQASPREPRHRPACCSTFSYVLHVPNAHTFCRSTIWLLTRPSCQGNERSTLSGLKCKNSASSASKLYPLASGAVREQTLLTHALGKFHMCETLEATMPHPGRR